MARAGLLPSRNRFALPANQFFPLALGLAIWLGVLLPAEAFDELRSLAWRGGPWAKATGSPAPAQTTNGSKDAGIQATQRDWQISASTKGYYDYWRNDSTQGERGHHITELLSVGFDNSKLFLPSDRLSVLVEGGSIQSKVIRGGSSTNFVVPTDTTATITYSTFDGRTWGFEGSGRFNFPTGKTRLTELELLATPNPSVGIRSVVGTGFDAGFEVKYLRQIDKLHLYTGAGYTRRGSYDPTKDRPDDTVRAGDEYKILLGGNYQFTGIFRPGMDVNLGTDGSYTRVQGIANQDDNQFTFQIPARLTRGRLSAMGSYSLTYRSSEPAKAETVIRRQELQKGLTNTWNAEVGYPLWDPLTIKALGEGLISDTRKPSDTTFFATSSKYAFGLGLSWSTTGTPSIMVNASGKYFQTKGKGRDDPEVSFSGFSSQIEISGRF